MESTINMKELTESLFKGTWKSYKAFRRSGEVKQHSSVYYYDYNCDDTKLLTIFLHNNGSSKKLAETKNWAINFNDKRHYLAIKDMDLNFEVITINHVAMVLMDLATDEKLFFARPATWEKYIKSNTPVTL
jgi:hypothetical protein